MPDEDRSAIGALGHPLHLIVTPTHVVVGAPVQLRDDAFRDEERPNPVLKGRLRRRRSARPGGVKERVPLRERRPLGRLEQLFIPASHDRAVEERHLPLRLGQDDPSVELAAIRVHVLFASDVDPHHVGNDGSVRARRPRLWIPDQRLNLRFHQMGIEPDQRPAVAKGKRLPMRALQTPLLELPGDPIRGLLDSRRASQSGAVDVGQPARVVHDLRAAEPLVSNPGQHLVVEVVLGRRRQRQPGRQDTAEDENEPPVARHLVLP